MHAPCHPTGHPLDPPAGHPRLQRSLLAFALGAALGLTGVPAAHATDLGELTPTPTFRSLQIAAPDVTFSSSYFFSLTQASAVSAQAINLAWFVGATSVLDIADFGLSLFDTSTSAPLATAVSIGSGFQIDEVLLAAGRYRFDVHGLTTGQGGGAYSLSALASLVNAEPPMPPVPEPPTVVLLACGALLVGLVARRRRANGQPSFH